MNNFGTIDYLKLKTTSYDCFFQELMILCRFYKNEYQKIFLEQYLDIEEECRVIFHVDYKKNMESYYGLSLRSINSEETVSILKGTLYLVIFDINKYPLCNNLEDYDGKYHVAILYDIEDEAYILYDNFYHQRRIVMSKKEFYCSVVEIKEVVFDDKNEKKEQANWELKNILSNSCNFRVYMIVHTLRETMIKWEEKNLLIMKNF